jgi:hypothetical protein
MRRPLQIAPIVAHGTGKRNDPNFGAMMEVKMSNTTLEETQLKELFKQAIVELLQEHKDLLYELVVEIMEDFALLRAIKEGEETPTVGREEVFRVLEGAA